VLVALGDEVAAQRRPHVPVRLDQPGHHDHPAGIDDLRAVGLQITAHGDDLTVLDQNLTRIEDPEFRIDGDNDASVDQVVPALWPFRHCLVPPIGSAAYRPTRSFISAGSVRSCPGSPSHSIRPLSPITARRSATSSARSTFCSATRIVWPSSLSLISVSRTTSRIAG